MNAVVDASGGVLPWEERGTAGYGQTDAWLHIGWHACLQPCTAAAGVFHAARPPAACRSILRALGITDGPAFDALMDALTAVEDETSSKATAEVSKASLSPSRQGSQVGRGGAAGLAWSQQAAAASVGSDAAGQLQDHVVRWRRLVCCTAARCPQAAPTCHAMLQSVPCI